MITERFRFISCMTACLVVLSMPAFSQIGGGMGGGESSRIDGKVKFMPIPYVNYDRSMGFTAGAIPMLMFNPVEKDTLSPSSLVGAVGTYSTNKSWFLLGFGIFYFDQDNWRITTAGGVGVLNSQFYLDVPMVGGWIPYQSAANFAMLKVDRRLYETLYGGVSYIFTDVLTTADGTQLSESLTMHGMGLSLSYDKRSNPYYPRSGYLTNIKYNTFPGFFGNDSVSHKIQFDHNHYFSVRKHKDVVAARFYAGLGLGELGFTQQFIVKNKDIRGYAMGEFRGDHLLALQGEYRWNFHRRWGAVGFVGLATVLEAINDADSGKLLPGGGAGIRFRVFPETNFSVGLDVAAGVDDWGIYFQIGEAF